jgi:lysophospholipase L1-like esterase
MKKRLLFIGDSLIEYFDWAGRFPFNSVYNMGMAGETVDGLYSRIERIIESIETPDRIFIMSGINNLAMEDKGFVPKYRKIISKLVGRYPEAAIFVHGLLPVLFPFIGNDDISEINRKLRQVAAEERVSYLDIHSHFLDEQQNPRPSCLAADGVHLSEEGYRVWSGEIEKLLT